MAAHFLKKLFRSHPIIANSTVYGSLYVGAEFSQQLITQKFKLPAGVSSTIDSLLSWFSLEIQPQQWHGIITQERRTFVLGDKKETASIDYFALGRYFVVGSLINSNYFYAWYKWLDNKYVGTSGKIIFKKVLLDQFVMTPPLYVIFYISMSLMEGRENLLEECREKFLKTFSMSCLFWLPVQTINFLYLPNVARVVYMGVCSFAWVNILCWIKRSNSTEN